MSILIIYKKPDVGYLLIGQVQTVCTYFCTFLNANIFASRSFLDNLECTYSNSQVKVVENEEEEIRDTICQESSYSWQIVSLISATIVERF